jgi:cytochrome c oxidase cbb3-type subunit 3
VLEEGAQIFYDNCASCHGDDARGIDEIGAPNLTDDFWIYGGDAASLFETIHDGRQGWMPAWEGRLTAAEIRMLAVYMLDVLPEGAE